MFKISLRHLFQCRNLISVLTKIIITNFFLVSGLTVLTTSWIEPSDFGQELTGKLHKSSVLNGYKSDTDVAESPKTVSDNLLPCPTFLSIEQFRLTTVVTDWLLLQYVFELEFELFGVDDPVIMYDPGVDDPVMMYSSHLSHRIRFPISEKVPLETFIKHREHVWQSGWYL